MTADMTIRDKMETFEGATIQHGLLNNRIYLIKVGSAEPAALCKKLEQLARHNRYEKIVAKIPAPCGNAFLDAGYTQEAAIPGFYQGKTDALFLAKYFSADRQREDKADEYEHVLQVTEQKRQYPGSPSYDGFAMRPCDESDAEAMSEVYRTVFPSYPFPIDNPDYLRETMRTHIDYFGVTRKGSLIALSSAEMDLKEQNVEMTDFATLPAWRGRGLAFALLALMEDAMRLKEMKMAYTIARAISPGMNITFARHGYKYGGRLVNNTNISGQIESMNVWFKPL